MPRASGWQVGWLHLGAAGKQRYEVVAEGPGYTLVWMKAGS
jgi:hypothetical protein